MQQQTAQSIIIKRKKKTPRHIQGTQNFHSYYGRPKDLKKKKKSQNKLSQMRHLISSVLFRRLKDKTKPESSVAKVFSNGMDTTRRKEVEKLTYSQYI